MPTLNDALRYTGFGYSIFPLAIGVKVPRAGSHGVTDATTDEAVITGWWAEGDYNIGMSTNGMVAIDVDRESPWLKDADRMQSFLATEAPYQRTANGGRHYLFRASRPTRNSASVVAPKVDVRGDGGYIVAAPSKLAGGREYRWMPGAPLVPRNGLPLVPQWLDAMIQGQAPVGPVGERSAVIDPAAEMIPQGCRDATLAALAGTMRRVGMGQEEILAALVAANRRRCSPPLPDRDVKRIAASVSRYEPDQIAQAGVEGWWEQQQGSGKKIDGTLIVEVPEMSIEWLWQDKIALGCITMLVGDPGVGKSIVSLDMAARISAGIPWPNGAPQRAGHVLLLSCEDDVSRTIKPRLRVAHARTDEITYLDMVGSGALRRFVDIGRDIDLLSDQIASHSGCRCVIVDPISAYLGKTDAHRESEVRALLAPLNAMAAEHQISVICVGHLRKGEGAAIYRASGSLAFVAAARAAWIIGRDPVNDQRRLMVSGKNNLAVDRRGMAYELVDVGGVPRVAWSDDVITASADDVIGQVRQGRQRGVADIAAEWLAAVLSQGGVESREVRRLADDEGLAWRTVQRARDALGVVVRREGQRGEHHSIWVLPGGEIPNQGTAYVD